MSYDILYCALCGKNYNDVNKLITEDGTTVCDVCYDFCQEHSGNHHREHSERAPEDQDPNRQS